MLKEVMYTLKVFCGSLALVLAIYIFSLTSVSALDDSTEVSFPLKKVPSFNSEKSVENIITTEDPLPKGESETPVNGNHIDAREVILRSYLASFNSPLEAHVEDFLAAADKYGIDWKLVPAISGVESTFGKRIPGGHDPEETSYNGWGWGVYGDQVLKFQSWEQGIEKVSRGLKIGYIDQGLTDPYAMNPKYAASPEWGWKVAYFLSEIESHASEISAKYGQDIAHFNNLVKKAAEDENNKQRFDTSNIFFSEATLSQGEYQIDLNIREY